MISIQAVRNITLLSTLALGFGVAAEAVPPTLSITKRFAEVNFVPAPDIEVNLVTQSLSQLQAIKGSIRMHKGCVLAGGNFDDSSLGTDAGNRLLKLSLIINGELQLPLEYSKSCTSEAQNEIWEPAVFRVQTLNDFTFRILPIGRDGALKFPSRDSWTLRMDSLNTDGTFSNIGSMAGSLVYWKKRGSLEEISDFDKLEKPTGRSGLLKISPLSEHTYFALVPTRVAVNHRGARECARINENAPDLCLQYIISATVTVTSNA